MKLVKSVLVAAVAVIENPFAGRYVEDLAELVKTGEELGDLLGHPDRWPRIGDQRLERGEIDAAAGHIIAGVGDVMELFENALRLLSRG